MIYLDHAAATPVDDEVLAAMRPYWQEQFYNPGALYTAGREVSSVLHDARRLVAGLLGAGSGEIYFTAGATESINIALNGLARRFPNASIAVSKIEHESVLGAAESFDSVSDIKTGKDGLITAAAVKHAVKDDTVMVSVGHINSEIGTVQPLREISTAVEEIRRQRTRDGNELPIYFHSDGSASPGYADITLNRLGVDMLTLNGAKIYGPKQSGILYVSRSIKLAPYIRGGGQELGLRSGTENVAFAIGFARALEISCQIRKQETRRQAALRDRLMDAALAIPRAALNGPRKNRSAGNLNVGFSGVDGETLVHYLDVGGIMAATGAACSANNGQSSHVLKNIGVSDEHINGSVRFSLGRNTTEADIDTAAKLLAETVLKLRRQR